MRDAAASDVVGTTLLVVVTVLLASAFSAYVLSMPGPVESPEVSLALTIDKGAAGWGSGDEEVRVRHKGGFDLFPQGTRIHVTAGGTSTTYSGATLGDAFSDGSLSLGETWTGVTTLTADDEIAVAVVSDSGQGSRLLARAAFVAADCTGDAAAPLASFTQAPADVRSTTTGAITLTTSLDDGCAGVDSSVAPHLYYRVNGGSDPAYTDAGVMTSLGGHEWQATIPDANWAASTGATLQYYAGPLTDLAGNMATSSVQSDLIDDDPCGADATAPTGSFAQSPADVTMNTTGVVSLTLTASDACAGVDDAQAPLLHYRVDDGTNPAYTNGGAMALTATSTWQASIPDPSWLDARGDTLQYYASGLSDLNGNTGDTSAASDLIDNPCDGDVDAPTVTLSQSPADVSIATVGAVNVSAMLADACAGVDASVAPHLYYRVNDGSDPAYTDGGAMSSLGVNGWHGVIPDPAWADQGGKTLQYYVAPLTDRFGNTGASSVRSDTVDLADPCAADTSAPTPSFAQSPANVTMNSTSAILVTLTASDDCAGVDDSTTPHLYSRVEDGSSPAYTDLGAMTLIATSTWQASIPDPTWLDARGNTLQYFAGPLADSNGNTVNTATQSDVIDDPCSGDTSAPTASLTASPSNMTTQSTSAIAVNATLADACAGVDASVTPHLHYRLNDGGNPAYADAGAMTSLGSNQWAGTIPDLEWDSQGNKTLQYYVAPLTDRFGNTGAGNVQADLVDVVVTHTEWTGTTETKGTVTNANSALVEDGEEASLAEGVTTGGLSTVNYNANIVMAAGLGWTSGTSTFTGDNAYATDQNNNPGALELGFADQGTSPGSIVSVIVKAEVSIVGWANDAFTLQACIITTCSAASSSMGGSATDVVIAYNVTALRPGEGTWTFTDIDSLTAKVQPTRPNDRDGTWRVDHVYVEVKYVPTAYSTDIRFDFGELPSGVQHDLEIGYRVAADTFLVQVWNGTEWNTRGTTLLSGSSATWSYTLTSDERASTPRIRFVDVTPSGTAQGILYLDYVRVKTT